LSRKRRPPKKRPPGISTSRRVFILSKFQLRGGDMNDKNLIPISERTKSEAREIGSKGGRASGASRRRRKSMEQCAKYILSLPANSRDDWSTLISAGVSLDNMDPDDIDNMTVVNAAIIAAAKSGDVAAFKALRDVIRDDERLKIEKERLKLEKQKLADKNDNSDVFAKLDDVLEKIGSDPT
jgi:hypothetical protein